MRNEYCKTCNKTGYNMIRYVNYREYRYAKIVVKVVLTGDILKNERINS